MGPAAPVGPGDVLAGKYEVMRVLGVGGMGVVVAARHIQLKGQVAIKFLLPEVAEHPEIVARFLREAQAATRIRSEHVARVLDVGTLDGGAPYMIMEFLEGQDLGQLLGASGTLSVQHAVDFVLQAMEALAEAHALGIVHRDLKPSNLFLTQRADGSALVKVLDFGISKTISADPSESQLTKTQGFIGSPLYMSPEQIRSSKHVDARSDVWSLGVILYELLSGRLPFGGDTASAILASIVADLHAPLDAVRPDVPPALCRVLDRCLEKSPDRRFATVADLAIELAPFGTRDAEISRTRITGVVHRGRTPSITDAGPRELAAQGQPAMTAAAWSGTTPQRPSRRWLVLLAAASATVLFGLIALAIFVAHRSSPHDAAAGASASASSVIASEPPPEASSPRWPAETPESSAHALTSPDAGSAPSSSDADATRAPVAAKRPAAKPSAPPVATRSTSQGKLDGLIEDRR